MEKEFLQFVEEYESFISPLEKEFNQTYFDASIEGKEELYKKAAELELKISGYLADKERFQFIKEVKESGSLQEQITKRLCDQLYNSFAANQYSKELLEEIVELSNKLEERYATFRAELNGSKITDNQIDDTLKNTNDSEEAEAYWKASKQIGAEVRENVLKLVKLRNRAAVELGYKNYHEMSLKLSELEPEFLDRLFDDLDKKISPAFTDLKALIDEKQSKKFKIKKEELMPWHYGDRFFQSGPEIFSVDFDPYFENENIEELTKKYFNGISLPIDDLIVKSDLYEKEGKYQHAYCMDVDRNGDVRVVCNIKPNHRWMSTMLHEFGHAVYDKFISKNLPWTLRQPSHIFTTEAIAMLFGRFASFPSWIKNETEKQLANEGEIQSESFKSLRAEQLIFSRWVQVVYRFEKELYSNPDQDLNLVWKGLVEKYQLIKYPEKRDEPDWAAKIHIALYPAYYQNYMLGELLASQLYYFIKEKVLSSEEPYDAFNNRKEAGDYLKNLFFLYGSLYHWNELIEKATGEKLNTDYYINQFVKN